MRYILTYCLFLLISCRPSNETPTSKVTDIDGNVYESVKLCDQEWTTTNLNVSKFRNGDPIIQITDATAWNKNHIKKIPAWCYYENKTANGVTYGKLYNCWAVLDPRGLAPAGWHIPSDAEWAKLETCLGGAALAGGKMKSTLLWMPPNTNATNSSKLNCLPGGNRRDTGLFEELGLSSVWWSSTKVPTSDDNLFTRILNYNDGYLTRVDYGDMMGYYVRCVKD